jgi:PAS domain S-box-containing protein
MADNKKQMDGPAELSTAGSLTSLTEGEKLQLLVDSVSGHAVYMLDPEGYITSWTPGAEKVTGYNAEDMLDQHFSQHFTEEDRRAGAPEEILREARDKGRAESEGWRVRKDGSQFWASAVVDAIRDAKGGLIGFAKVSRDVTERKLWREALLESEKQSRKLVEAITDYALLMLDPEGIVTSWNAGAQRIKGYTSDEIIGQHFSRFYTERDQEAGIPARALQVASSEGRFEAEGWRVRKNGEQFWANVVIDPIRDSDGNLTGFAKITQDITEKRNSTIALQKADEQRGRAQRMEALGHLTGGVAHDFNNLLMIIGGFTQTLKKATAADPKAARAIEAIGMAVERGQSLTRQLLTFSRRQTLNPTVSGVAERIEAFSQMLGSSSSPATLVASIPPDIWPIRADIGELELALLNITINARDAMPDGGVITVTAQNVQLKSEDTAAQLDGDYVAVSISDDGTGIAEEILPKVFDPFFTTKQVSKGSGLGLSQVYGFAHQSGGTVTIESKLGEGTRVTLYLPRTDVEQVRANERPASTQVQGRGVALLVDDNRDVLELSALFLQELGYQVEAFDNAQPALKATERQKFELVVSDIVMAGMDGIDLAQAIRQRQPDMPIVLVTGYSRVPESVGEEFVLVRKPYQLEDLSRAVSTAIAAASRPFPQNASH